MKGLGQRIKSLRKSRSLTLVDVTGKTGIDMATLSRIENGLMTGTLNSHVKIADVLGVSLPELYDKVMNEIKASRDKIEKQRIQKLPHSKGVMAELLTAASFQKRMIPLLLKFKSGAYTEAEELKLSAEKFIYVLKGSLQLDLGGEKRTLKQGESLYFNASLPHSVTNQSKSEAWCLSVLSQA